MNLKLGTRRSLLAWGQSSWVARQIERLNPGTRVELVGIDTRGDKIVDVSLRQVAGKEFFVAELDDALRSREVDLTVHSLKDLSLERPPGFSLAAIPARENSRDAVLFGPHALSRLARGVKLRIGTSSPRRIENIPPFLERALPGPHAGLEFLEIRGNVNTRLSRVQEAPESERYLDGVVLALAGLNRLWGDPAGRAELDRLLTGVRWMILPLIGNPTNPGQGALAVECLSGRPDVSERIARLDHAETRRHVDREREVLSQWGGGCHQRFGASSFSHPELGDLLVIQGVTPDGEPIDEIRWAAPPRPSSGTIAAWDGSRHRAAGPKPAQAARLEEGQAVFVAHSRAAGESDLSRARVWTSGQASWFRLAEKGVWVEGCAEGLGFESLQPTLGAEVLGLPALDRWTILTHAAAAQGWKRGRVLPTYELADSLTADGLELLSRATHCYWSSGSQFDAARSAVLLPAGAHHACGPGKTASHLRTQGVEVQVFPSVEEWKKWLKN